jgi:hypothetical protein
LHPRKERDLEFHLALALIKRGRRTNWKNNVRLQLFPRFLVLKRRREVSCVRRLHSIVASPSRREGGVGEKKETPFI